MTLLRSGARVLSGADRRRSTRAEREIWLETYIFADDATGRAIADALVARRAARRQRARARRRLGRAALPHARAGAAAASTAASICSSTGRKSHPWQFRSHRLRRLHRKLCHVDGRVAFVGGINIIDDMNTPGHKPPRVDFAVRVRGSDARARSSRRCSASGRSSRSRSCAARDVPLFPGRAACGTRWARRWRSSRSATTCAIAATSSAPISPAIRTARREILIATAYFFPGVRFRRALISAAARGVKVTLLLQARVEYRLLHYASRALYGQLLTAGVAIQEYHRSFLHAKVAVVDRDGRPSVRRTSIRTRS